MQTLLAAVVVQVPVHHVRSLKDLLRDHPRLQYVASGWILRKFAILGPPGEMAVFHPKLQAWEHDCVSRDGW